MERRFDGGTVLAALGALAILVSLFLDWFEPDLSAWTTFETMDLVLAALSLAVFLTSVSTLVGRHGADGRHDEWIPIAAGLSLLIVVATLINHPPAAIGLGVRVGIWLALGGALAMVLGSLAGRAQISFSFSFRRTAHEPARPRNSRATAPADEPGGDTRTRPIEDTER